MSSTLGLGIWWDRPPSPPRCARPVSQFAQRTKITRRADAPRLLLCRDASPAPLGRRRARVNGNPGRNREGSTRRRLGGALVEIIRPRSLAVRDNHDKFKRATALHKPPSWDVQVHCGGPRIHNLSRSGHSHRSQHDHRHSCCPAGCRHQSVGRSRGHVLAHGRRNPGVATRFGPEDLAAIPTRRSGVFDLVRAAPGISPTSPSSGTINTISAYGSSTNENSFLIDGTDFTSPSNGAARADPGVDFVQEVHVQSVGASVEYGNVQGAVVNVVTRQGGNRFTWTPRTMARPRN